MEYFKTRARCPLTSSIDDIETTLTVDSPELFPVNTPFRVLIDNEILKVTGTSGSTFTVERGVEGTSGGAHTGGANVTLVMTASSFDNLVLWEVPDNEKYTARSLRITKDNCLVFNTNQSAGTLIWDLALRSKLLRVLVDQTENEVDVSTGDIPNISLTYDPVPTTPAVIIAYMVEVDAAITNVIVKIDSTEIYTHADGTNKFFTGFHYYAPGGGSKTYKLKITTGSPVDVKKATLIVIVLDNDHMTSDETSAGDGGGEGRGDIDTGGGGE